MASSHLFRISPRLSHRVLFALAALPAAAFGQVTWSGLGANAHFSLGDNWVGGLAPANDGTAEILFGPASSTSPAADSPWSLAKLSFAADAPAYSLSGAALTLDAGNTVYTRGLSHLGTNTQTVANDLVLLGFVEISSAGTLQLDGAISAPLEQAPRFSGFSGASVLVNGALTRHGETAFFVGTTGSSGFTTVLAGANSLSGVIRVEGDNTLRLANVAALSGAEISVTEAGSRVEFDLDDDYTLGANVTGNGELHHTGSATLTLQGERAYFGATRVIGGGTLVVTDRDAHGYGELLVADNASVLRLEGDMSGVRLEADGGSRIDVAGELFGVGLSYEPAGPRSLIQGGSSLVVLATGTIGAGVFDFSGDSTLELVEGGNLGVGATFNFFDTSFFIGAVPTPEPGPGGGGGPFGGPFFGGIPPAATFNFLGERDLLFDGNNRFGPGTLGLGEKVTGDFTAVDILDYGRLTLFNSAEATISLAGALGAEVSVSLYDQSRLHLAVTDALGADASLDAAGTSEIHVGADNALNGVGLSLTDDATLILGGHDVLLSELRLDSPDARIVNDAAAPVTLTIDTTRGSEGGESSDLNGVISDGAPGSGALSLTIVGFDEPDDYPGVITVTAPQAYSGPTLVTGYVRFEVVNDGEWSFGSLVNSALTASGGATISGTGPYGTIHLAGGATLSPGTEWDEVVATLEAQGVSLAGSNTLSVQILDATAGPGLGWDSVNVAQTLSFSTAESDVFLIVLAAIDPDAFDEPLPVFDLATAQSFELITAAGGLLNFDPARIALDTSGFDGFHGTLPGSWSVGATANTLTLYFTPGVIPEPASATALLGAVALAAAAARRRRR